MHIIEAIRKAIIDQDEARVMQILHAISNISVKRLDNLRVSLITPLDITLLCYFAIQNKASNLICVHLFELGKVLMNGLERSEVLLLALKMDRHAIAQHVTEQGVILTSFEGGDPIGFYELSQHQRQRYLAQVYLGELICDISTQGGSKTLTSRYPKFLKESVSHQPIVLANFINGITTGTRKNPFTQPQWETFTTALSLINLPEAVNRQAFQSYVYPTLPAETFDLPKPLKRYLGGFLFLGDPRTFEQLIINPKKNAELQTLAKEIAESFAPFGITQCWGKVSDPHAAQATPTPISDEDAGVPSIIVSRTPAKSVSRTAHRRFHRPYKTTFPAIPQVDPKTTESDISIKTPLLA